MNLDLLFIVLFYGIILIYYLTHKKRFEVQDKIFVLYKTKLGLQLMDKISKKGKTFLKYFGYLGVFIGYLGMAFIFSFLLKGTYNLLFVPGSQPLVAPVLPGIKIQGLPTLSFWHWIISILLIAGIHEFCHGVYARLANVKIKSSGFAFLGPILAAFVEPDEKQLVKKSTAQQLSVLSAGPFSNIISAIIFFLISLVIINPIAYSMVDYNGVQIINLEDGFPAQNAGLKVGEEIISVNNVITDNINSFSEELDKVLPGEKISIQTNNSNYTVITSFNPKDSNSSYLGIIVSATDIEVKEVAKEKYGETFPQMFLWLTKLFFWLYAISLGVGLFNLLPLGPVDGGRMFYLGINKFIKNDKISKKIFTFVSLFVLFLIFVNLLPYIYKLIMFIVKPFLIFLI